MDNKADSSEKLPNLSFQRNADSLDIKAMITPDAIYSHDDGNGGMMDYMLNTVLKAVRELSRNGTQAIKKAIEAYNA